MFEKIITSATIVKSKFSGESGSGVGTRYAVFFVLRFLFFLVAPAFGDQLICFFKLFF